MSIEELKARVGEVWQSQVYEIEKGMLRRFARAIGDPNPRWQDDEYARKTKYGGIIAPPTLVATLGIEQIQQMIAKAPDEASLHGGTELECHQPIRAGDVITATTTIADFRQRQGKMGKTTFVTFDIMYKNQRDEPVGRCRQVVIYY